MAKSKHNASAPVLIEDYIDALPDFSKAICKKLRSVILTTDPAIVEDWKWGPNYYCEGMICGFGAFQKHVSLAFMQGVLLKDPKGLLQKNPGNVHNRHMKFVHVSDINEAAIRGFIKQTIANNKKGEKLIVTVDKTVEVPNDVKSALKKAGRLKQFNDLAYSHRKEYVNWIIDAKKEETRIRRIDQMIDKLEAKEGLHDRYKKK